MIVVVHLTTDAMKGANADKEIYMHRYGIDKEFKEWLLRKKTDRLLTYKATLNHSLFTKIKYYYKSLRISKIKGIKRLYVNICRDTEDNLIIINTFTSFFKFLKSLKSVHITSDLLIHFGILYENKVIDPLFKMDDFTLYARFDETLDAKVIDNLSWPQDVEEFILGISIEEEKYKYSTVDMHKYAGQVR